MGITFRWTGVSAQIQGGELPEIPVQWPWVAAGAGITILTLAALKYLRRPAEAAGPPIAAIRAEVPAHGSERAPLPPSLRRLSTSKYAVFSQVRLPVQQDGTAAAGAVIDFVVVSRHGIFVVKAIDEAGDVNGHEDEAAWTQIKRWRQREFPNPVWEANRLMDALAQFLELPDQFFTPLVFFSERVEFRRPVPPNVLSEHIGRYIAGHRKTLMPAATESRAVQMLSLLSAGSRRPRNSGSLAQGASADPRARQAGQA